MIVYNQNEKKLVFVNTSVEDVSNILDTVSAIMRVKSFVFIHEQKNYMAKNIKPVSIKVEFEVEKIEEL